MLIHLPGAYRATQIFGSVYDIAPLSQRYAMELMALAVDRDVSYQSRPVEEIRESLEPSRRWVASALQRYRFDSTRWLPQLVLRFLEDRKASEILMPPALISEPPISPRVSLIQPPPRLPLIMWREAELQPLLSQWSGQLAGLQRFLDQEPPGEILDPKLQGLVYFYQTAEALMRLAFFDELTGLRNRRELGRLYTDELHGNLLRKRQNSPGDFFLGIDIDHFKKINDAHGHAIGDIVLQKVAKRLFELTRKGDYVFRVGGEEFLIYLVNVGDKGVPRVAQKIRSEISKLEISVPGLAKPIRVTISIGVSRFRLLSEKELRDPDFVKIPPTPLARLQEEADRALYRAKEKGRNRVVYYWKK